MNAFLWSCVAILSLFVSVECLTCKTCDASVLGHCLSTDPVNCSTSQDTCYSGVASLSRDVMDIYSRGCTERSSCRNFTTTIFTNVNLTVTMHCCTSNLCNGAGMGLGTGLGTLPLLTALGASLVALGTVWGL